jgi:hypothetical protein
MDHGFYFISDASIPYLAGDGCFGGGVERVNFAENRSWDVTIMLGQTLN